MKSPLVPSMSRKNKLSASISLFPFLLSGAALPSPVSTGAVYQPSLLHPPLITASTVLRAASSAAFLSSSAAFCSAAPACFFGLFHFFRSRPASLQLFLRLLASTSLSTIFFRFRTGFFPAFLRRRPSFGCLPLFLSFLCRSLRTQRSQAKSKAGMPTAACAPRLARHEIRSHCLVDPGGLILRAIKLNSATSFSPS